MVDIIIVFLKFRQALELAAKNVVAIVGPGSTSVAVHLASLMGTSNVFENGVRLNLRLLSQRRWSARLDHINNC